MSVAPRSRHSGKLGDAEMAALVGTAAETLGFAPGSGWSHTLLKLRELAATLGEQRGEVVVISETRDSGNGPAHAGR
jgi:hypothetical protein